MNYSTTFPATENPVSEGGVWLNGLADGLLWLDIQTIGGIAYSTRNDTHGDYRDPTAVLTGTWGGQQVVTAVAYIRTKFLAQEIELRLNSTMSANTCTGYEILFDTQNNNVMVIRWDTPFGTFAGLTAGVSLGGPIITGSVLGAAREGNDIVAYFNGVEIVRATDTTYMLDAPGFGLNNFGTGTDPLDFGLSSFTATDGLSPVEAGPLSVRRFVGWC